MWEAVTNTGYDGMPTSVSIVCSVLDPDSESESGFGSRGLKKRSKMLIIMTYLIYFLATFTTFFL